MTGNILERALLFEKVKTIRGVKIKYCLSYVNDEYIIRIFREGCYEEICICDSEDCAKRMFWLLVNGNVPPGSMKDVLEDYCTDIATSR